MNFDIFTPIEETNLISNIESSKGIHGISVFIPSGYSSVLSKINNELREEYRQKVKDLQLEHQKQNKDIKYTYKKRSANTLKGTYKRKKLTSEAHDTRKSNSNENNELLTDRLKKILKIPLDSSISKESNEINRVKKTYSEELSEINNEQKIYSEELSEIINEQKTYSEKNNEVLFDYPQGFEQLFSLPSEYNIFGLESPNQFPLTGYSFDGWQSTENLENPTTLIYGEDPSELIYDENLTEKLVDHSVLMGMLSTENIENPLIPINSSQSSEKLANLDRKSLMRLLTS
ncbi:3998_t:CDS:2 [Racocetra fulgida]|uniref:3998_t:CDS:1 n=1 Tax=Racocetra fulgida TaxID=60492 RepID=A0A9N8Z034_9GLOM|nr:3998_t:CDS:2 [Racocetra fulgida]